MKRWLKISVGVLAATLAFIETGCSDDASSQKENIYVDIMFGTRVGDGSEGTNIIGNRTYRVILFHPDSGEKLAEGTYYDEDGTEQSSGMLTPWATNDSGDVIGDSRDKSKGLYVVKERKTVNQIANAPIAYSMVIVSPAWKIHDLSVAGNTRFGFAYPRVSLVEENQRQYVSDVIPVEITARGEAKTSEDGKTIYYDCIDLEGRQEAILKERRSKIHFEICGSDKADFTLSKVQFLTQKEAYYAPFRMEYISEDETNDDKLTLFVGTKDFSGTTPPLVLPQHGTGTEDDGITYSEANDDINGTKKDFLYLLSQDYSAKDENNELKYLTPELVLSLLRTSDSNDVQTADVKIPLSINAEPHHRYFFKIVVESVYVTLRIYVDAWDEVPKLAGTISSPIEWKVSNAQVTDWDKIDIGGSVDNN